MTNKSSLVELTPLLAGQRTLPLKAWVLELARRAGWVDHFIRLR